LARISLHLAVSVGIAVSSGGNRLETLPGGRQRGPAVGGELATL
jgi:hypothetical protein